MAHPLTLCIAIVDGEHARFVQPDTNNVLRTLNAIELDVRPSAFEGHWYRPARPGV